MSQRIKPLPSEALNGLGIGITPFVIEQKKESDISGDNSNTLPKEKGNYRLLPTLTEALVNTQPELTKNQIKRDALKKDIADAEKIKADKEAEERRKINDWKLNKKIDGIFKEAEAKALSSTGGYKKVKDKYTVKELKAIASRNNIKITKKLNGKTVPLNKKGLFAKLKRNKVI
jgi:hypothetical protein